MTISERDGLRSQVDGVFDTVVALRRDIHRQPELGTDNPRTQRAILDALDGLGLDISTGSSVTSVTADLHGARNGPVILLRADTDALPMTEESGEDFSSEIEGRAHACGHDAHVAMLVGAARVLSSMRSELAGTIRFVFQPGEEGFGGARNMIDEGALALDDGRPVDAAFALHISPNIPSGYAASRPGPIMASTDDFRVVIRGKGAHASTPHFGNDPVPVAAETVLALQNFVTRRIDAFNPAVITVGRISAGTTSNVIPETAEMEGTIRTMSEATRLAATTGFDRVVNGVAAAHDCVAEIEREARYPVTVNDADFVSFAAGQVEAVMGEGRFFELPSPVMGAEDFSYFLQKVPGAMVFLGVCPDDIANSLEAPGCHSNVMRLNEAAMAEGVALHVAVATAWLREAASRTTAGR